MLRSISRPRFVCSNCRYLLLQSSRRSHSTRASNAPDFPVRTRFAPSPTGYLHLGSLRTALFNYLLAKRTGGQFILRIEDTDDKRTVPGAEKRLCDDLRWAGLQWDEGPEVGGPYGPYRQSERNQLYQTHAHELVSNGHAYRCFCTAEALHAKAKERAALGLTSEYDRTCFHIPPSESESRAASGEPYIVRLKDPDPQDQPIWTDVVHGAMGRNRAAKRRSGNDTFDDAVLLKSDGVPTYHLANVVDDHHMKITHVIRGVEWLISTRKHVTLYKAFGWDMPAFVHVGLLLDEEGSKLSKRDLRYDLMSLKDTVLPEALTNFLALLGWSHKERDEFFSMEMLKERFDLNLNKSNPIVDLSKLWFLSPRHAKARVEAGGPQLDELISAILTEVKKKHSGDELQSVGMGDAESLRNGVEMILRSSPQYRTAEQFVSSRPYFFNNSIPSTVEKQIPHSIRAIITHPKSASWSEAVIREKILATLQAPSTAWAPGKPTAISEGLQNVINDIHEIYRRESSPDIDSAKSTKMVTTLINFYLRAWVSWGMAGPGMADTLSILGKDVALDRIRKGRVTLLDNVLSKPRERSQATEAQ